MPQKKGPTATPPPSPSASLNLQSDKKSVDDLIEALMDPRVITPLTKLLIPAIEEVMQHQLAPMKLAIKELKEVTVGLRERKQLYKHQ